MPMWTQTDESLKKYEVLRQVVREYDVMLDRMKAGVTFDQVSSDRLINRMEAARAEWIGSMPRKDP